MNNDAFRNVWDSLAGQLEGFSAVEQEQMHMLFTMGANTALSLILIDQEETEADRVLRHQQLMAENVSLMNAHMSARTTRARSLFHHAV